MQSISEQTKDDTNLKGQIILLSTSRNRGMAHPFFINMLAALLGSQFYFYLLKAYYEDVLLEICEGL